jgi:pectate lyase
MTSRIRRVSVATVCLAAMAGTVAGASAAVPTPGCADTSSVTDRWPGSNLADGWAGVNAWDQDGTTGGAGGQTVLVDTEAAFNAYATCPQPYVILVNGVINLSRTTDVGSDKTVVGVGSGSGFSGYGLNVGLPISDAITSPPADAVHNVILRNLRITGAADDGINVQMFSHHIWIDHNDLSDPDDGTLDITRGSSYVTVSWNHAHDPVQDSGRLKVTYHHNWFERR